MNECVENAEVKLFQISLKLITSFEMYAIQLETAKSSNKVTE